MSLSRCGDTEESRRVQAIRSHIHHGQRQIRGYYCYLESVVEHDLDEGVPQPRDLHAVLDLPDEDGGVDVRADVVEEDVDEVGLVDGVVDQRRPQLLVVVLLAELSIHSIS